MADSDNGDYEKDSPILESSNSHFSKLVIGERERSILKSIVQSFIRSGEPVGSRSLSKMPGIGLSAATIRNTMSDLEELGLLGHPYTSAGRVPTELGYRLFVDTLMEPVGLSARERKLIEGKLGGSANDTVSLLKEGAAIMAGLSGLLAIVLTPTLSKGVLHRLDVIMLSSSRVMFVVTIESGLVRTIVAEIELETNANELQKVVAFLNEKLSGLTLDQIRLTLGDRLKGHVEEKSGLVQFAIKKASLIFGEVDEAARVNKAGTESLLNQPEFDDPVEIRKALRVIDEDKRVIDLLEKGFIGESSLAVRIGSENVDDEARSFSLVISQYGFGSTHGTIGVLGPKRMDYARILPLVRSVAESLDIQSHKNTTRT